MGVKIDKAVARVRFAEALDLARSDAELPQEWIDRADQIAKASSMTFTPMLGTALLAKATNDAAGALTLKATAAHNAYSARGVCHDVLVPMCVDEGINIRTTGKEPLNNQPFFRYEKVDRAMRVRATKAELDLLVRTLEEADFLRGRDALEAFAAFLRSRIADPASAAAALRKAASGGVVWPFDEIAAFVRDRPDGGRRAQACVAAALDLVHPQVTARRVNDPSRDFPGDVHVSASAPTLAVEAKQKVVTEQDVAQLVERCATKGIARAAVAAFATDQPALDVDALRRRAMDEHGVLLEIWHEPAELLRACAMQSADPPAVSWGRFAERMLRRLEEIEAPRDTIEAWIDLVAKGSA